MLTLLCSSPICESCSATTFAESAHLFDAESQACGPLYRAFQKRSSESREMQLSSAELIFQPNVLKSFLHPSK